jgi:predicted O-methyltransferase YrrM
MDAARLLAEHPNIHGDLTHFLVPEALNFIEQTVQPGHRTLETGAGFSTIILATLGAEHTTVVYDQAEVDRIRSYCQASRVPLDNVTFVVDWTEHALPTLELGDLDLVLLDGSHAFPGLFIEWFYIAAALKTGGHLIVDDIHLWTGRVLRDFLRSDPAWNQTHELHGRTAVFTKVQPARLHSDWSEQPYVRGKSLNLAGVPIKARQATSMLRHGQSRTFLHELRQKLRRGGHR